LGHPVYGGLSPTLEEQRKNVQLQMKFEQAIYSTA